MSLLERRVVGSAAAKEVSDAEIAPPIDFADGRRAFAAMTVRRPIGDVGERGNGSLLLLLTNALSSMGNGAPGRLFDQRPNGFEQPLLTVPKSQDSPSLRC
jgi:hypothetical protein